MFATIDKVSNQKSNKHQLAVGCMLLGVAAIPDTMVVPVLHELTVEKFDISQGVAHLFMAINLSGALIAIGLLAVLNRRLPSSTLFFASAVVSATMMGCMANTSSWAMMLVFRCIEGGADLLLLAIPFRLIAGAGLRNRYANRIGIGFTVMMVSLALGAGLGGGFGGESAEMALWLGSGIMTVLALIAVIVRRIVDNLPPSPRPEPHRCPLLPREWLGAGFLALDRGLAALVSTSLPILLASGFDITPMTLGVALGGMFLSLAVFSTPAGILADIYGGGRIRLIASCMTGLSLVGLGLMAWFPPVIILPPCLLVYGVGAAGLMPSAFCASVRPDASNLVFSSLQGAGQAGYAIGVLGGSLVITSIALPAELMFSGMFPAVGIAFIFVNCLILLALRSRTSR